MTIPSSAVAVVGIIVVAIVIIVIGRALQWALTRRGTHLDADQGADESPHAHV